MKTNTILQNPETDGCAACLVMLAKHYGKEIDVHKIKRLLQNCPDGVSGLQLIKAAESMGLSCRGAVTDSKEIPKNIPYPFIAHLVTEKGNKYIVVRKADTEFVYTSDSFYENKKLSLHDFKKNWTGVFFIILPAADFSKQKSSSSGFARFFPLLKTHKKVCAEIIFASIILSFLGILSAFYFRFLIDEVLYSGLEQSLRTFSIGFLAVIIFRALLGLARNQLLTVMSFKIDAMLIHKYFEHVVHLPTRFFTGRKTGEILARMNDANTIRQVISATALTVVLDSLMLIFGGIFLISLGSNLIAAAIIPVVISAVIVWLYAKPYQNKIRRRAVAEAEKHSCIVESLNGISTIKALAAEDTAIEQAEFKIVNAIRHGINLGSFANFENSLQNFISSCGTLAIYWLGSLNILNGKMSLGQLISFVVLSGYFLEPLSRLLTLQPQLQEAYIAAERLSEIFDEDCEADIDKGSIELDGIDGKIEIKNVSFGYDAGIKKLHNINLEINPGEKVAFVGSSGSGKTTLAKLLMKFYKPQEGDIFIDGVNLQDVKTDSFRKQIGYVPQEILLFSGTIEENINWGTSNNDLQRTIAAARAAEASSFIEALPDRYNTFVGEHGATLSGGERQRIAIARILLRNPAFLILDEATAGLDSISENAVMKTLNEISAGRTTIIIAHRLSTITECDKIFVLKNGEIVEAGSHADLLEKDGAYSKLWATQNNFIGEEEAAA